MPKVPEENIVPIDDETGKENSIINLRQEISEGDFGLKVRSKKFAHDCM